MGFASAYLEKRALFPDIIKEAPDRQTGIIVVVPAYDEPEIISLLNSLASCYEPECKIEVIIILNAPANADIESIENNKKSIKNIESWKKENNNCFFRLFVFNAGQPAITDWGVGLARKAGMDEAVRRFNIVEKPGGIIVNLDADCRVERNYFTSIFDELFKRKEKKACSVYFEHPLSGSDFSETIYNAVALYELHLRYYFQGLRYAGFPYVFHTVGSAIAVKALTYVQAGGMNRKQAGEDFYFIQKLIPAGGYFNLISTTVYPSPRPSLRVPFGTGSAVARIIEDDNHTLLTYNTLAFEELRSFFSAIEKYYYSTNEELKEHFNSLPPGLRLFINEKEWYSKLVEIKNNTSGLKSFQKRFYGWFNMFRIVKYLNYTHISFFNKMNIADASSALLEIIGMKFHSEDTMDLLLNYRTMERAPNYSRL